MQLGHLTHLLHWRPAFPLTHTSPAFWQKLLPSLASSQLLAEAELSFVSSLAGDFCRLCVSHWHHNGHLNKRGQVSLVITGCKTKHTTFPCNQCLHSHINSKMPAWSRCVKDMHQSAVLLLCTPPRPKTKENVRILHRTLVAIGDFGLCSFMLVLRMTATAQCLD